MRTLLGTAMAFTLLLLAACAGGGDSVPTMGTPTAVGTVPASPTPLPPTPVATIDPREFMLGPPVPGCMTDVSPSGVEHTSCFSGEPPRSGWYLPLLAEESKKPLFDGEINGIRIGPDVESGDAFCESIGAIEQEDRGPVPVEESVGTPLNIAPTYLPEGSEPYGRASATQCGGVVDNVEREYWVPADLSIPRWGGSISIYRWRGDPLFGFAGPAADRAEASEIAGRPAVLFHPITPEGFGLSAIVVREDFGLTFLHADGVSMEELVRVAESLY